MYCASCSARSSSSACPRNLRRRPRSGDLKPDYAKTVSWRLRKDRRPTSTTFSASLMTTAFVLSVSATRLTAWKRCSCTLSRKREQAHESCPEPRRRKNHHPQRDGSRTPHLDPDNRTARDYDDAVLHYIRQPYWPPYRRHGRLRLHAVHSTRADHDVGDYKLLRERRVIILRRQVRSPPRRDARRADVLRDDHHRPCGRRRIAWLARRDARYDYRVVLHQSAGRASFHHDFNRFAIVDRFRACRLHQCRICKEV